MNSVVRRDLILKCGDKSKKPEYASRSPFKSQLSPFLYYFQKIYLFEVLSPYLNSNNREWQLNSGTFCWLPISFYDPTCFYTAINLFLVL